MQHLFKTALIWLIALAIPAQGFAASTMLFCGSMHQHMAGATTTDGHPEHQHIAATLPDHQHRAMSVATSNDIVAAEANDTAHTDAATDLGKTGDWLNSVVARVRPVASVPP